VSEKVKMVLRNPWRKLLVLTPLFLAVLVGFDSGSAARAGADSEGEARTRTAQAPFSVLIPSRLPADAILGRTEVQDYGNGLGSVDLSYKLADGTRLHIWETNRPDALLGDKAPSTLTGLTWSSPRAPWLETAGFSGTVLVETARIAGTLVSVDAKISSAELRAIADSVR
jgi:hypothetical protein